MVRGHHGDTENSERRISDLKFKISESKWDKGLEGHLFDFDFAAFALDADVAGGETATGDLVHGLAINEEADAVSRAHNLIRSPFTGRIFIGCAELTNENGFVAGGMAISADSGMQNKIALMLVLSLALDAFGPYGVGTLNMDKNAGIVRVWGDFHKPPDDGEIVIVISFFRAHVAVGLAGAVNHTVGHAPGIHGIGVVFHAKGPAVEIVSVEELDAFVLLECGFATGENGEGDYGERNAHKGLHLQRIALAA